MKSTSSACFFCKKLTSDKGVALVELVLVFVILSAAVLSFIRVVLPALDEEMTQEMVMLGALESVRNEPFTLGSIANGAIFFGDDEAALSEISLRVGKAAGNRHNACAFRAENNLNYAMVSCGGAAPLRNPLPAPVKLLLELVVNYNNRILAGAYFEGYPDKVTLVGVRLAVQTTGKMVEGRCDVTAPEC
jgi:hypothetical protein